jgi:hypothetical protein
VLGALLIASLLAQAEPAPAPAWPPAMPAGAPTVRETEATPTPNALGVSIQIARRLAEGGPSLDPYWGFSVSGRYERHLLATVGLEVGAALDFSFQYFGAILAGPTTISDASRTTSESTRLTETTFAVLPTVARQWGKMRPFACAGVGVGVGFFSSQDFEATAQGVRAVQPIARGGVGLDVATSLGSAVTVRADYTHAFTRPQLVTDAGHTYALFGDLFNIGIGFLIRF